MKKKLFLFFASISIAASVPLIVQAQQLKVPAPSPLQTIKQAFALSEITIEYSRPGVKGRTIYGDLVPFGKIWRTGANQSTKITFGEDVSVEGKPVEAGTYAIYTIPNKTSWDILFYKDLKLGGDVEEYKPENELFRFKATPTSLPTRVETFTIQFANISDKTTDIEIVWEQTRVAFKITSEIDPKIMKNIETALATDSRPYFQAARYYYENDKDLKQALEWINKAVEINPKAYYMVHVKAKILLKMNDKAGAIEAAEKSMTMAKDQKSEDYVRLNEKLLVEAKKK